MTLDLGQPDSDCPSAAIPGLRHGTRAAYNRPGVTRCRCRAARRAQKVYRVNLARGRSAWVSAVGSCRRLRALALMGYSTEVLSKLLGINPTTVRRIRGGSQDGVYLRHHQQIKALYAELLSRGRRGASQRAVVDAVAHGWVSAGSWNDADLDDPRARPIEKTSRVCAMTPARRIDVAELLRRIREGETVDGIARHFGVKRATVKRRITRLRTAGVLPPYDPTIQTRSAA